MAHGRIHRHKARQSSWPDPGSPATTGGYTPCRIGYGRRGCHGIPAGAAAVLPLWHALGADNTGRQCARCQRASRDKLIAPPEVPVEFWLNERLREAFAAQDMGRVARAYRTHPYQRV